MHGTALEDADFSGGGDRVRYSAAVGDAPGPFTIEVELLYQPIGYRWANNLVYVGFSDWRLPTLKPSDFTCGGEFGFGTGYNRSGGEFSGLFVTDLGNKKQESVLDLTGDTAEQIANLALFSNVQSRVYWSGTEYAPPSVDAWAFNTSAGA